MGTNGTNTAEREDRTLHIRYRESDEDRISETLEALDRGERPDPYFEVVFHEPEDIHRVTRPQNLELLRAIVREGPQSIRETARVVGRDVRPVHRNLVELESLHLLELVEEGQAKRPHVWYDGIELDIPLNGFGRVSDAAMS